MPAATAPIKVDAATDHMISDIAHFTSASKKQVVDTAVREYIENHRKELNDGVAAARARLDGSTKSIVSLMTGFSDAEIDDLGGVSD